MSAAARKIRAAMLTLLRILAAAVALAPALALPQLPQLYGAPRDPMQHFFSPSLGDLKGELADAKRAGKQAAFVMYMRDDCPYCERMKRDILSLTGVQAYYRKHFAVLAVDIKGAVPVTDFAGKQTTEKDFAAAQGVRATPVIVFYGFDGKPLTRVDGEIRSPEDFLLLGDFVVSGAYKSMKFADYQKSTSSGRVR
jgi:thioredoxin-related protein